MPLNLSVQLYHIQMNLALEELSQEEEDLKKLNLQLQARSQKFGSQFTPLTLGQFKLFKIQKAKETGNIEYLSGILLEEVQDLQERKQKIKERIQSFYPQLKVQSQEKFFEERQAPDFADDTIQLRQNTWHLFGVDYMSNQKIRNYFSINPHFRIEWLNDSSCNLVFNSSQEAEAAVKPHIRGAGMQDETDIWYELEEYEVEGVKRRLFCRLATNKDIKKKDTSGKNSQYYKWQMNKRKLGSYVKRQAYRQINKTKGINRRDRHHQGGNRAQQLREKRQQREEEREKKERKNSSSSSGFDSSSDGKMSD